MGMERRIEAGDLGQVGAQRLECVDRRQPLRIVQGSQIGERVEDSVGLFVEEHGIDERRAAVDDAVASGTDLGVGVEEGGEAAPGSEDSRRGR